MELKSKIKYFVIPLVLLMLLIGSSKAHAFFGLTIEDIMERCGISRTDRIPDIKKLVIDALKLDKILPEEFKAPDISGLIDMTGVNSLVNSYNNLNSAYKSINKTYETIQGLPKSVMGDLSGLASEFSQLANLSAVNVHSYSDALNIDWSKYAKTDKELEFESIDVYKAVTDRAKELYGDKETLLKNANASMLPGSSLEAALGAVSAGTTSGAKMNKVAADFASESKKEIIERVLNDMTHAELLRDKIKESSRKQNALITDALADSSSSLGGSGAAWKASAAGIAATARLRTVKNSMMTGVFGLMRLRVKINSQLVLLGLYDYADYCHKAVSAGAPAVGEIL